MLRMLLLLILMLPNMAQAQDPGEIKVNLDGTCPTSYKEVRASNNRVSICRHEEMAHVFKISIGEKVVWEGELPAGASVLKMVLPVEFQTADELVTVFISKDTGYGNLNNVIFGEFTQTIEIFETRDKKVAIEQPKIASLYVEIPSLQQGVSHTVDFSSKTGEHNSVSKNVYQVYVALKK